jgi:DMSO/TMAO reductase YedYZ molybdopterin-dependent catalytic subunit
MSLTRRQLLGGAGIAGASLAGVAAAARIADKYGLIPPDHNGIFGIGETLTYGAQRLITSGHSLVREFSRSEISKSFPVNGGVPENDDYQRLAADDFVNWRLNVGGLVARPASFSLADLKRLPLRSQITLHACEEGWSCIAEWTGVLLSDVMNLVGVEPDSKYVVFFPFDSSWESIDMADALHPQTLLAYGMNGKELPYPHGGPLRVRVARQLGYKSVKYLSQIEIVDSVKHIGKGLGSSSPEVGYSWYAGI